MFTGCVWYLSCAITSLNVGCECRKGRCDFREVMLGRRGMMGCTLFVSVNGVEGHRGRAARRQPPAGAVRWGQRDHWSRPVMCGAVAGLWLARERSVYGFSSVALRRLSA